MKPDIKPGIRNALRIIAENHAATMAALEKMLLDPAAQLDGVQINEPPRYKQREKRDTNSLYVDPPMLSVIHCGKRCFLGNTIPFRLITKLIDNPNRYFSYDELFTDVWGGIRSETAVRSVVKVLRSKLRNSKLHELAKAIDGSVARHYGLIFGRISD